MKLGGGVNLESQRVTIVRIVTPGILLRKTVPLRMTDDVKSAPLERMRMVRILTPVLRVPVALPGAKKVPMNALLARYVSQGSTKV